jgi:murein DD-endopeptidase MepM/ murein hydrolase activator NlpD
MSPGKQAGLVLAVATLAVVTAIAVIELLRAPPRQAGLALHAAAARHESAAGDAKQPRAPPAARRLAFPVKDFDPANLRDSFDEIRGKHRHEALDIMAARGTPVVAVDDGRVARMLRNLAGGITLYQLDRDEAHVYYYAHLDAYAKGLAEGAYLKRGDLVGFVGSTGNAPAHAPHLHFGIFELADGRRWWKGRAVNPYPLLRAAAKSE